MSDKYEFIDAQKAVYAIRKMCLWIGVSVSGYYDWRIRPASATLERRAELSEFIAFVFRDSDGTYGYRRVHAELARCGVPCGPELVRALMRQAGLMACQPRPFRPATTVAGDAAPVPDLVGRDFTASRPGVKLVGDITYIPTWQGWMYLATVTDCHTKECIGYAVADHMRTELVTAALDMAATNYSLVEDCIFHSDRGTQGEFQRSSQHLYRGGALWRQEQGHRSRQRPGRVLVVGSGPRIGRCARRCARPVGRSPRVRSSVRSGG